MNGSCARSPEPFSALEAGEKLWFGFDHKAREVEGPRFAERGKVCNSWDG